jgi:dTMP kinase
MIQHITLNKDLRRHSFPGKYVVVEGIDGSGKSTQLQLLKSHFEKLGHEVVIATEPQQDSTIAHLIRDILKAKIKVPSKAYQNLYSADRMLNHTQHVIPALQAGKLVISHRCFWSAVAYGIMDMSGDKYDYAMAYQIIVSQGILSSYYQFIAPDKTFYLQLTVEEAVRRLSQMDKQKEVYERKEKLQKIVKGYDWLLQNFPNEFVIIDGGLPVESVTEQIISHPVLAT